MRERLGRIAKRTDDFLMALYDVGNLDLVGIHRNGFRQFRAGLRKAFGKLFAPSNIAARLNRLGEEARLRQERYRQALEDERRSESTMREQLRMQERLMEQMMGQDLSMHQASPYTVAQRLGQINMSYNQRQMMNQVGQAPPPTFQWSADSSFQAQYSPEMLTAQDLAAPGVTNEARETRTRSEREIINNAARHRRLSHEEYARAFRNVSAESPLLRELREAREVAGGGEGAKTGPRPRRRNLPS